MLTDGIGTLREHELLDLVVERLRVIREMGEGGDHDRGHSRLEGEALSRTWLVQQLVEGDAVPVHEVHPLARSAEERPELGSVDRGSSAGECARHEQDHELRKAENVPIQVQHVGNQGRATAPARHHEDGRVLAQQSGCRNRGRDGGLNFRIRLR